MVRSTAEKDGAEFHDDEDSAEQTDEGGGGGDGPRLNEDLNCVGMFLNGVVPTLSRITFGHMTNRKREMSCHRDFGFGRQFPG